MFQLLKRANSFLKDLLLASRIALLFKPFSSFLKFLSHFSLLTAWINRQSGRTAFSDFYKPLRTYTDRLKLYKHVSDKEGIGSDKIEYLEFGVAGGTSFKWWLAENKHLESLFFGFDTFEGLPENWAFYKKGAMSFTMPTYPDERAAFYKGLFQETLYKFLEEHGKSDVRRVIHMDADLYSSTLFALTMLAPYLKAGDILFFDEFNVPNHEFAAWHDFTRSYYIEYEVLGAVNNFYQTAFKIIRVPGNAYA